MATCLVMAVCLATTAAAAPGDLDVGFGRGGVQRTNFGWDGWGTTVAVEAMLRQPDGSIVVGGTAVDGGNAFALVRYLPDGMLDPAFGDAGRAVDLIGRSDDSDYGIRGIVRRPDGTLLATGPVRDADGSVDLALVHYLADGSLDPDFGTDGSARLTLERETVPVALAEQADGRLVIAGFTYDLGSKPFLARFHPDGTLDTTFGNAGVVVLDAGSRPTAVTVQRDGKVLVAVGDPISSSVVQVRLARFTADGVLDSGFAVNGVFRTGAPDAVSALASIVELEDGRLVLGGSMLQGDVTRILILRLRPNGTLDPTFGFGGVVATAAGWVSAGTGAAAVLADGRIIVAGGVDDGHSYTAAALRFDTSGNLDPTFGDGGIALASLAGSYAQGAALTIDADGGIVIAGTAHTTPSSPIAELLLGRFDATGHLDSGFGSGGIVITPMVSRYESIEDLAQQRDGKLLAVGATDGRLGSDLALARYLPDGALDPVFGDGGRVRTDFGGNDDRGVGVVEQASGRIVAGGQMQHGNTTAWMLVGYAPDGSLDPTFGTNGTVRTDLTNGYAYGFLELRDGKLLIAGTSTASGDYRVTLMRYLADGTPDASFGTNGRITGSAGFSTNVLMQQSSGKVIVAGSSNSSFAAMRFNPGGLVDTTFGYNGTLYLSSTAVDSDSFSDLIQRADGGLLGVGSNGLVFLDADGHSSNVRTGVIPTHAAVRELLDGTFLAVGTTGDRRQFTLARYGATGVADTSFGSAGRVLTDLGKIDSILRDMLEQPGGVVVTAGGAGTDFALARYAVAPCAGDASACDDGDPCSQDVCSTAGCASSRTPRLQCGSGGRAQLTLENSSDDARDQLVWKLSRGSEVSVAALGDPAGETDAHLCLYAGETASIELPAGAGWQAAGTTTVRFRAAPGSSSAAKSVLVKAGGNGKTKAYVKAGGAALPDLVQPGVTLPLTVQLVNDAGLCLGSTFEDAKRNDARQLIARTP